MNLEVKIGLALIALVVVIFGACIIYGRSLVRSGRERKELHRRRVEDAEREEMFAPVESCPLCRANRSAEDDTKTWPGPEAKL